MTKSCSLEVSLKDIMLVKLFKWVVTSTSNFTSVHYPVRNFVLKLTYLVFPNPSTIHLKQSPETQFSTCIPAPSSFELFPLCAQVSHHAGQYWRQKFLKWWNTHTDTNKSTVGSFSLFFFLWDTFSFIYWHMRAKKRHKLCHLTTCSLIESAANSS